MPRALVMAAVFAVASTVGLFVSAHPGNPPFQAVLARPQASDFVVPSPATAPPVEIAIPDGSSIAQQTVSTMSRTTPTQVAADSLALSSATHLSIASVSAAPPAAVVDAKPDPPPAASSSPLTPVESSPSPDPTPNPTPNPTPTPTSTPPSSGWDSLSSDLVHMAQATGGHVAISLVELGPSGQTLSLNGQDQMVAASTYKLPLLIAEARGISDGSMSGGDQICYQSDDWEDGYFQDYVDGACYSRDDLATRIGINSDNTAAHMLLRDLGGTSAFNAKASSYGATNSTFFDPNTTTANDLAAIWQAEYSGNFGGAAAQQWLYPKLTGTRYEDGIPAGVPSSVSVVHKIGEVDSAVNDAALVENGGHPYILVVLTDGTNQGFAGIAALSARVWQYEATS